MRRKIETHKPGKVTKIIPVPEVTEEQAEVEIEGRSRCMGRFASSTFSGVRRVKAYG
jgi:hypothetical protein